VQAPSTRVGWTNAVVGVLGPVKATSNRSDSSFDVEEAECGMASVRANANLGAQAVEMDGGEEWVFESLERAIGESAVPRARRRVRDRGGRILADHRIGLVDDRYRIARAGADGRRTAWAEGFFDRSCLRTYLRSRPDPHHRTLHGRHSLGLFPHSRRDHRLALLGLVRRRNLLDHSRSLLALQSPAGPDRVHPDQTALCQNHRRDMAPGRLVARRTRQAACAGGQTSRWPAHDQAGAFPLFELVRALPFSPR